MPRINSALNCTSNRNLSRKKRTEGKRRAKNGRTAKSPYSGYDSCSQSMDRVNSAIPITVFLNKNQKNRERYDFLNKIKRLDQEISKKDGNAVFFSFLFLSLVSILRLAQEESAT